MEYICGPFTLSIAQKEHLIFYVIFLEIIRIGYRLIAHLLSKTPFLNWLPSYLPDMLIAKYLFVFVLKFFLIFEEEHRKKFYLHSFLQEAIILIAAVLFDCLQKQNVKVLLVR